MQAPIKVVAHSLAAQRQNPAHQRQHRRVRKLKQQDAAGKYKQPAVAQDCAHAHVCRCSLGAARMLHVADAERPSASMAGAASAAVSKKTA